MEQEVTNAVSPGRRLTTPTEVLVYEEEYPEEVSPEEAKRVRMRKRILDEILQTEETYQQHLALVVKVRGNEGMNRYQFLCLFL